MQLDVFKYLFQVCLTLLHSERPKLYTILAFLSAVGLYNFGLSECSRVKTLRISLKNLEKKIYSNISIFRTLLSQIVLLYQKYSLDIFPISIFIPASFI